MDSENVNESVCNNKTISNEERLQLAAKLDKELDEFISGLERRPYTEGWPEDRWEEEMEKHPFFMKEAPEPGSELHPLLEGIQQLKYDPEENTAEELAVSYKEDGNFNFKHKNYRLAILSYTEGIKQKHDNMELRATLHNNRAAANYFLHNYRSCIRDCEVALKLKPDYEKARIRAAECFYHLNQYDKCIQYCDELLLKCSEHKQAIEFRQKAINARKTYEKQERKRQRELERKKIEEDTLLKEIQARNLNLESEHDLTLELLEPRFPQLVSSRVFLNENKLLIWPVVFLYPEYKTMDFVQQFPENVTIVDQLRTIFDEEFPAWDEDHKYVTDNLNVYFEAQNGTKIHKVAVNQTLGQTLENKTYTIKNGTPSFIVLVAESTAEKYLLKNYL